VLERKTGKGSMGGGQGGGAHGERPSVFRAGPSVWPPFKASLSASM
jgi:hypothetical protein